jgi:hypothetical protein
MEKFTDTLEWPLTGTVKISRGKYYHESLSHRQYKAIRFHDRSSGRYYYDLYFNDEIFLTRVNPLFLDFLELF